MQQDGRKSLSTKMSNSCIVIMSVRGCHRCCMSPNNLAACSHSPSAANTGIMSTTKEESSSDLVSLIQCLSLGVDDARLHSHIQRTFSSSKLRIKACLRQEQNELYVILLISRTSFTNTSVVPSAKSSLSRPVTTSQCREQDSSEIMVRCLCGHSISRARRLRLHGLRRRVILRLHRCAPVQYPPCLASKKWGALINAFLKYRF